MSERFEFDFGVRDRADAKRRPRGAQMRMLVMGDFSGSGTRGLSDFSDIERRPLVRVDIDNFDAVLRRFSPCINVPDDTGEGIQVCVAALDDFHPDALFQSLPRFHALNELRKRLLDPATFAGAAAQLWGAGEGEGTAVGADEGRTDEREASMFERLLGKPPQDRDAGGDAQRAVAGIDQFIAKVVSPYAVAATDRSQAQCIDVVDEAIGDVMRGVLHHPEFQAVEAAWRSLHGLVTRWEGDHVPALYVLDVSRRELAEYIAAAGSDLTRTPLYTRIVDDEVGALGGEPWSLIVGNYNFSADAQDLQLLAALGTMASQAGGSFLAAAHPAIAGCRSLVEAPDSREWAIEDAECAARWGAFRQSHVAPWIGLALPRVLLRLPYGKNSDPVDCFRFEELGSQHDHEAYLWGNPAFACALLIGQAFQARGWAMAPDDCPELDDLPCPIYEQDGEMRSQACAEVFLTEHAAQAMLDMGLMPLVSYRDRHAVRVMRFQSIAAPATALAGPWR